MKILGISAFYHDSAAALVVDGEIVAAAQEERFSRKKHDARFPRNAIRYCLEAGGIESRRSRFRRLLRQAVPEIRTPARNVSDVRAFGIFLLPHGRAVVDSRKTLPEGSAPSRARRQFGPSVDWAAKLLFTEHHLSHAASAFFPSPFEEAVVLTMDGVGEWATTSVAHGRGNRLEILKEIHFPHSLGLLYSAFTYYTGFKVNSGEYKLMGLAPYGEPKFTKQIFDHLIDVKPDGSFHLNLDYFNYCAGLTMTNARFHRLFGLPPRKPSEPLTQQHMDIAASIQAALEEVILRLTRSLAAETGVPNLCLAGGVALNCVANGKVLRDGHFKNIWIQPASGDAGGALGAALAAHYQFHHQPRNVDACQRRDARAHILAPNFRKTKSSSACAAAGARFQTLCECELTAKSRGRAGRRKSARLVSRPHGIWPARARSAVHPGRRPVAIHAERAQSQGEVSRVLPALCAVGAARTRERLFRTRHRQPLHAAGSRCGRASPPSHVGRRAEPLRHREARTSRAPTFPPSPMSIIPRASRPFIEKPIRAIMH